MITTLEVTEDDLECGDDNKDVSDVLLLLTPVYIITQCDTSFDITISQQIEKADPAHFWHRSFSQPSLHSVITNFRRQLQIFTSVFLSLA